MGDQQRGFMSRVNLRNSASKVADKCSGSLKTELTTPALGYVSRPLRVTAVRGSTAADFDNTSPESFDLLYFYSRRWEPKNKAGALSTSPGSPATLFRVCAADCRPGAGGPLPFATASQPGAPRAMGEDLQTETRMNPQITQISQIQERSSLCVICEICGCLCLSLCRGVSVAREI